MQSLTGKNTGDTLTAAEWNQLPQEVQNTITAVGIGLSSGDLQQLNKSIVQQLTDGDFYDDQSGAPDVITAAPAAGRQGMREYTRGAKIRVRMANTNTGPTSINVNAVGGTTVRDNSDSPLTGGELSAGAVVDLEFNPDFDGGAGSYVFEKFTQELPSFFYNQIKIENDNGGDVDHDLIFTTGSCRDFADSQSIFFGTPLTKQIDANWAEGDGVGGLASAAGPVTNDTWYHCFVIAKPNGTTDCGMDTSITATNLLTDAAGDGYTKYRYVNSVLTDASSDILLIKQRNNDTTEFESDILTSTADPNAFTDLILNVPPDYSVEALLSSVMLQSSVASGGFSPDLIYRTKGDTGGGHISNANRLNGSTTVGGSGSQWRAWTNTAATIEYFYTTHDGSAFNALLYTDGWRINRSEI